MTTKERILHEALNLFAEKGYSAVYVGEIAEAVGIKTPSLYKHFKSKQDIFDSCVEVFAQRMNKIRNDMQLPGTNEASFSYETIAEDHLIEIANSLFLFYLKDDFVAKFRKMLMIERYNNFELNIMYEDFFIVGAIEYEEKIFTQLITAQVIKNDDPHIIALRFYTPIFYLLQKYDMRPADIEEAKQELTLIVREFCRTYRGVKNNDEKSKEKDLV